MVPEAINFLLNAVLHLGPHILNDSDTVPGLFPTPDFQNGGLATLNSWEKAPKSLKYAPPDLVALLCGLDDRPVLSKLALLATTLQLLGKFAEMYKGLDGFVELYTPVLELLQSVIVDKLPLELQVCLTLTSRKKEINTSVSFTRDSKQTCKIQYHVF